MIVNASEDLLLGVRLPVFRRRAKRKLVTHPKFYYFDVGVYRTLRPRGPYDVGEEIEGVALETLVFQELRAQNENLGLEYDLSYWRTTDGKEVDFVLYGPRGLIAIEVKRSHVFREKDLSSLRLFLDDAPAAEGMLLYGGASAYTVGNIRVLPVQHALPVLPELLRA